MKLTKERLVQIIKEEIEMMELDVPVDGDVLPPSAPPEQDTGVVKDKATLAKELIRIARDEILRSSSLDSGETAVIHNILTRVLAMAEEGSTASTLKTLSTRIPDKQS